MRIAVVENEEKQARSLKKQIEDVALRKEWECRVDLFFNGVDFLTDYTEEYDAVFLDIEMPLMDGMETAERLRQTDENVAIVFVTNMAQYAIKGYRVGALDFLVKPVDEFDVTLEMEKIFRISARLAKKSVWINAAGALRKVVVSEIRYIETINHNVVLHLKKEELSYRGTLKDIESKLDEGLFARPDNCYLVNMYYIRCVEGSDVRLTSGEILHISRPRKKAFLEKLNGYINRG